MTKYFLIIPILLCLLTLGWSHNTIYAESTLAVPQSLPLKASWYGRESCTNPECLMSNGEVFDPEKISCASRQFYGKTLKITYKDKTILCPVKDRIAKVYDSTRVDLSVRAFSELEDLNLGIININYEIL